MGRRVSCSSTRSHDRAARADRNVIRVVRPALAIHPTTATRFPAPSSLDFLPVPAITVARRGEPHARHSTTRPRRLPKDFYETAAGHCFGTDELCNGIRCLVLAVYVSHPAFQ